MWEAKDEVAESEKKWEKKLELAQKESEQRTKSARTGALIEAHQAHKGLLQQLFPEVSVSCGSRDEEWLEEFEGKAQTLIDARRKEVRLMFSSIGEKSFSFSFSFINTGILHISTCYSMIVAT